MLWWSRFSSSIWTMCIFRGLNSSINIIFLIYCKVKVISRDLPENEKYWKNWFWSNSQKEVCRQGSSCTYQVDWIFPPPLHPFQNHGRTLPTLNADRSNLSARASKVRYYLVVWVGDHHNSQHIIFETCEYIFMNGQCQWEWPWLQNISQYSPLWPPWWFGKACYFTRPWNIIVAATCMTPIDSPNRKGGIRCGGVHVPLSIRHYFTIWPSV